MVKLVHSLYCGVGITTYISYCMRYFYRLIIDEAIASKIPSISHSALLTMLPTAVELHNISPDSMGG